MCQLVQFSGTFHLLLLLSPFLLSCSDHGNNVEPTKLNGLTMGTTWSVVINEKGYGERKESTAVAIENLLEGINRSMSTWIADSELMVINNNRNGEWIPVSKPLYTVIASAQQISRQSEGAFDITIGPLVNLWGFGAEGTVQIPDETQLAQTRDITGYGLLELDPGTQSIRKLKPGVFIDLSAIAKGYAVDRMAAYLDHLGLRNYMVEIGGEIKAKGVNTRGLAWQIGLQNPQQDARAVQRILTLDNTSLATSGDYRNYFEIDGKRYSHTIDPATARPVIHNLASVTVLHPSCMVADALATAILVLGPVRGYSFAERENVAALLLVAGDNGTTEIPSPAFR